MDTLFQDLRFALRMLLKNPGFTAVAAITLALGIGANTAIFSVVEGALLRPLPYLQSERLSILTIDRREAGTRWTLSTADFQILREQMRSYESLAAFTPERINLKAGDEPERVMGLWVTGDFFTTLGVPPILGRTFRPGEDRPGASLVAVISHALWQRHLSGDPNAIGRSITLDDKSYTVIGVMPRDFAPLRKCEIWPILQIDPPKQRAPFFLRAVGRLKPGVGEAQLRAELAVMHDQVEKVWPDPQKSDWAFMAEPMKEYVVGNARPAFLVLLAAVAAVLLIAMANVANLLLSRAATREREVAVRGALGASRAVLVRQLLTESVTLAALGGGAGLLLALWGVDLLAAFDPGNVPRLGEVRIDRGVFAFTAVLSIVSGILFGLAPALQISRTRLSEALKEGGRTVTEARGRRRLRGLLVVSQMALALLLLVAAGLMIKSFERLRETDPGFEPGGLMTMQFSLPAATYPGPQKRAAFYRDLTERAGALPGVRAAAMSNSVPPEFVDVTESIEIEGRPVPAGQNRPMADELLIDANYFRVLGIPLLQGRSFSEDDHAKAPPVTVIDETMARRYFPGGDAIGKRIHAGGFGPEDPWITIVGVVGNVKYNGLGAEISPTFYVPYEQNGWWGDHMYLALRSSSEPLTLVAAVRRVVQEMDPGLPLANVRTGEELVAAAAGRTRFQTALVALFALLALLLAAVGIYGVISYAAAQRTHEIGVRVALGATRRDVIGLVVGQGMRLALLGVGLGVLAALALTRLMRGLLFGVSATDPATFASIALLLAAVAFVACYLPARRATRVDPMSALRSE